MYELRLWRLAGSGGGAAALHMGGALLSIINGPPAAPSCPHVEDAAGPASFPSSFSDGRGKEPRAVGVVSSSGADWTGRGS